MLWVIILIPFLSADERMKERPWEVCVPYRKLSECLAVQRHLESSLLEQWHHGNGSNSRPRASSSNYLFPGPLQGALCELINDSNSSTGLFFIYSNWKKGKNYLTTNLQTSFSWGWGPVLLAGGRREEGWKGKEETGRTLSGSSSFRVHLPLNTGASIATGSMSMPSFGINAQAQTPYVQGLQKQYSFPMQLPCFSDPLFLGPHTGSLFLLLQDSDTFHLWPLTVSSAGK